MFTLDDSACSGSVGDFVWEDLNTNGLQDADEPGVAGVKVELQNPAGETVAETETDMNGLYSFTRVDSGEYKLMFHVPEGFRFTANDIISDTLDSDVLTGMNGMTDLILISPGVFDNTVDAGIVIDCQVPIGKIAGNEENCGTYDPAYIDGNVLLSNGGPAVYYQWQLQMEGSSDWEDIEGANSPDYDPGEITVSTDYRRLARIGDHCPFVPSNVVSKKVHPEVEVVIEKEDATCGANNGQATAVATGGNPPYSYEWSTGAITPMVTGLNAGVYFVMVRNSEGCAVMSRVEIEDSGQPGLVLSGTDAACGESNGMVTAMTAGGTEPYSYLWSTGDTTAVIDSLEPGDFSVTVTDAMGCSAEGMISIGGSDLPMVSISGERTSCGADDGVATALGEGGVEPYSFAWSTGATTSTIGDLGAGTYEVTLTDAEGCQATAAFVIEAFDAPVVTIESTDTSCGEDDGSATVSATGGTGVYTYLWSNGAVSDSIGGLAAGVYSVTVTDMMGCTGEATVEIGASNSLAFDFAVENADCAGQGGRIAAMVDGGVEPYTYQWSTGQDSPVIDNLEGGEYMLTVQDANGCEAMATVVVEEEKLEININTLLPSCNGADGVVVANVSGGSGTLQYEWNTGGTESFYRTCSPEPTRLP